MLPFLIFASLVAGAQTCPETPVKPVASWPAAGATGVPASVRVLVQFDGDADFANPPALADFVATLRTGTQTVATTRTSWCVDDESPYNRKCYVALKPQASLVNGTTYTIVIDRPGAVAVPLAVAEASAPPPPAETPVTTSPEIAVAVAPAIDASTLASAALLRPPTALFTANFTVGTGSATSPAAPSLAPTTTSDVSPTTCGYADHRKVTIQVTGLADPSGQSVVQLYQVAKTFAAGNPLPASPVATLPGATGASLSIPVVLARTEVCLVGTVEGRTGLASPVSSLTCLPEGDGDSGCGVTGRPATPLLALLALSLLGLRRRRAPGESR